MKQHIIPPQIEILNAGPNGESRTIKAQYWKNSVANFLRESGFAASAVIEIYDEMKTFELLGFSRDHKGRIVNRHPIEVANTVHTSTGSGGNTDQFVLEHNDMAQPPYRIRRFTPRETFRIQAVHDEDIDKMLQTYPVVKKGKKGLPDETIQKPYLCDTALYQRAGNAIDVKVLEAIYKKMYNLF